MINIKLEKGPANIKKDLLANECNDSNACEDMLARQSFTWHSIGKLVHIVSNWFTQMSHEQRDVRLENTLRLAAQVTYQPTYTVTQYSVRYHAEVPNLTRQHTWEGGLLSGGQSHPT